MGLRIETAALLQMEDKPDRCPAPLGKRLGPERVWGSRPLSSANGVAGHWGAHRTVNPTLIAVLVQFQPTPPKRVNQPGCWRRLLICRGLNGLAGRDRRSLPYFD